jgi:hypothetical protein
MSTNALKDFIGRKGTVRMVTSSNANKSLRVPCVVLDVREAYGRTDYLVTPIGVDGLGDPDLFGSAWASDDKVTLDPAPADSPESDVEERRRLL